MFVWPLRPNWRESYRVGYEFNTEIITSDAGREQRRARRKTPRKTIEFTVSTGGPRWQALRQAVNKNQGPVFLLPEITAGVKITNPAVVGASNVSVAQIPAWAVSGRQAILVNGDDVELHTINSATGNTISFGEVTSAAWDTKTKICPALRVRLDTSLQAQQLTSRVAEARFKFLVDPASELPRDPGEPAIMFNGREVFVEPANWATGHAWTFDRLVKFVDYQHGPIRAFLPSDFNTQTFTADYICKTPDDQARLLAFYERNKGRQGEFYCPSDSDDVTLAAPTGNAFLFADGTELAAGYGSDPVNKALSFKLKNGSRFYRTVTAVTEVGGQSRIQLGQAVPTFLHPEDVEVISWMPVMRFAMDGIEFEWLTDWVSQVRFSYSSLESLPAE